jgi:hypothetical protein
MLLPEGRVNFRGALQGSVDLIGTHPGVGFAPVPFTWGQGPGLPPER